MLTWLTWLTWLVDIIDPQDELEDEIAELYTYSETSDIQGCLASFEQFEASLDATAEWYSLSLEQRKLQVPTSTKTPLFVLLKCY